MNKLLAKYKPGASIRTHLLVTALIWSVVGLMLIVRAAPILLVTGEWWMVTAAFVLGTFKSKFVLDKVAIKNMDRTLSLKDGTCIGGAYSWKTWCLVVGMIILGIILRRSPTPKLFVGFIYLVVGWALFWSSRLVWQQWRKNIKA